MTDFELWAAASDLLNHLTSLETYSEPELLEEYEALVEKIEELSEQLETFQSEQLRTLYLLGKFVTMRVSAFEEAFEGEPLQVLLEIGQHVERELFYGIIADIDPSNQPPEFHLERHNLQNAKPGEREGLIESYCHDWFHKSKDFGNSRDSQQLAIGLKVQCGAIEREFRNSKEVKPSEQLKNAKRESDLKKPDKPGVEWWDYWNDELSPNERGLWIAWVDAKMPKPSQFKKNKKCLELGFKDREAERSIENIWYQIHKTRYVVGFSEDAELLRKTTTWTSSAMKNEEKRRTKTNTFTK
jgi:hypothetical protein